LLELLKEEMLAKLGVHHERLIARMVSQLEKMEATDLEANPEEIESKTVYEEVPKEEGTAETLGALKEQYGDWHLAVGCRQKDAGQWWVLEEIGHHLQRDDLPCHCCMV
jgi:hypothetical protein